MKGRQLDRFLDIILVLHRHSSKLKPRPPPPLPFGENFFGEGAIEYIRQNSSYDPRINDILNNNNNNN